MNACESRFDISQVVSGLIFVRLAFAFTVRSCHPAAFYRTLPSMKTMKRLIWLWPFLIILGAMLVAVETKGFPPTHEITISYGNLVDTRGGQHSVQLVLHPDGSVTWRDLAHHIR
jgi:hypothetical protein